MTSLPTSYLRLTIRALHWERGRLARYEHRKVRGSSEEFNFRHVVRAARSLRAGRGPSKELAPSKLKY